MSGKGDLSGGRSTEFVELYRRAYEVCIIIFIIIIITITITIIMQGFEVMTRDHKLVVESHGLS